MSTTVQVSELERRTLAIVKWYMLAASASSGHSALQAKEKEWR
jgi:hypothetical protein